MLLQKSATKVAVITSILSVILAIVLATVLLGSYSSTIENYLNTLIPNTLFGALTLLFILTFTMAVGLPRQIAALSAGYLFGAGYGVVLATVSAVLACLLTLIIALKLFNKTIKQHYPKPLAKVHHFFAHDTFLKAIIIRIVPAGSNFLTNVLAGTAHSPITPYILGSALGFIPQMIVFSLMGAGLKVNSQQQLILSIILLVIALVLSSYLYRKTKLKLTLN